MKKILFLLIPFLAFSSVYKDFLSKNYSKVCNMSNIKTNDENILSLVGIACVKSDKLYLLPLLINKLKHTHTGRVNAIYFATIILQKKLLYSFLFDNYRINTFSFPKGDYILSEIFDKLVNNDYTKKNNVYIIKIKNNIIHFYKKDDKMIVDIYNHGKLIQTKWFR